MKFDIIFGLAVTLALAPNAVAWNFPGVGGHEHSHLCLYARTLSVR